MTDETNLKVSAATSGAAASSGSSAAASAPAERRPRDQAARKGGFDYNAESRPDS